MPACLHNVQTIVCADVVRHSVQAVFHRAFRQTKAIGHFLVREPPAIKGVTISDLLEPHGRTTPMQFSKHAGIHSPTLSIGRKSPTKEPFMVSTITSSPPLTSRIGTKPVPAFNLGFLALFFVSTQRPFPHPSPSVCSTSVLPFSWNVLQVRFPYRFSCRPRVTVFSEGVFSGKMVYPWRPSTIR